jgi:octaprenyl-diphosphate synthase
MENEYTRRLEKIEAVLDTWLPLKPDSSWIERVFGKRGNLISPAEAESLIRPGRDLMSRGGKRWRPLLMVLAAESIAGESGAEAALPLTPLVEFPHNASLIHDDIEDNSDERRGKPAVHLLYGADTAINGGAFLYFLPLACLSVWEQTPNLAGLKERIWTVWALHMRTLHLGQAMDIAWHRDFQSLPGLDEYDRMCRLKTGCLARLAALLGVYSGAAAENSAENSVEDFPKGEALETLANTFAKAAEELGVGFQILDDVKNLDTGVPGKKRGDDVVEGKKSLPVLLYLHRYPEKRDFASRCFSAARSQGIGASEVEELIAALETAGALDEAREKAFEYINESRKLFSAQKTAGFSLKKEGRELLAGLADLIG